MAPARKPDNEISLRATPGGFGTPTFEHRGLTRQVRVEGVELVYGQGESESRAPIGSLAEAGILVGELLGPDTALDPAPLEIDAEAAAVLAAWFGLGGEVLELLVAEAGPDHAATAPRLWPEHFDIAIESGSESAGRRANYGFSPGDGDHPEPYVYVGPWRDDLAGELWNATGFNGAELGYADLLGAADPLQTALEFCRARRQALETIGKTG
ncbi:MAG: hypothetical protein ABI726_00250 [bacterium]